MTEIISKPYPKINPTDEVYPVLIWTERNEIVRICIFDHVQKNIPSISEAHYLPNQILYESNDFVHEKGLDYTIGKIYAGVAIFTRGMKRLKTLETKNHKCHIFY
jgi:hypothetical protein